MADMQAQLDPNIAQVPAATRSLLRILIDECGTAAATAEHSAMFTGDLPSTLCTSWQEILANSVQALFLPRIFSLTDQASRL